LCRFLCQGFLSLLLHMNGTIPSHRHADPPHSANPVATRSPDLVLTQLKCPCPSLLLC
jgi:hypothetical protein